MKREDRTRLSCKKQKDRDIFDCGLLYNLHAIAASPTVSIVHFPEGSLVRAVEPFEHFRTIHG